MKLAPFLIGAISAQSGDDADRWDNTDFSLTDNIFTYAGPDKDERFDNRECTTSLVIQAVTCWESNHMGNLDHYVTTNDDGFGWKNIHHGHDQGGHSGSTSTGYGQGTQESTKYGKRVPSTSPSYQIGTYSRGMMTDGVNGAINKIDYHSAMAFDNRYSGCIYEAAGWNYDATTYNAIWRMSYGYDPTRVLTGATASMLNDASGVDRSNNVPIRPNWWHYFNSHVLNVGQFDNQFDSYERHLLVMANPAYEGLGYLNWITTFAKYNNNSQATTGGTQVADRGAWGGTLDLTTENSATGFVQSNIANAGTAADTAGTGTYNEIPATDEYDLGRYRGMISHNTHDTVTDLFSGGYAFHLATGCDRHVNAADLTMDAGYTNNVGIKANYDHQMNPEINAPTRTEATMFALGDDYYKYYKVNATSQARDSASSQPAAGSTQAEVNRWYSFLINPGQGTMGDPSLGAITDGQTFYPWMSMAAVSSFPHNDLGQDFRFNIRILHHGGRGFPYYFTGNSGTQANNVMVTDATPGEAPVNDGNVAVGSNFSITNSQINYLAQDSYYWYKVNTVMIKFPSYVRCPRFPKNITLDANGAQTNAAAGTNTLAASFLREEKLGDTFRCMDSANFNGHRGWDSSTPYGHTDNSDNDTYSSSAFAGWHATNNHRPDENHPLYIEQLTENDGSAYKGILVDHDKDEDASAATDATLDSEPGFICGDVPPFGSLTATDYKGGWYKCGQKYTVHGLMNTYDEHAQLEYGTMQEIWFQFWYHYVITWDTDFSNAKGTQPSKFWDKRNSNTNRYASPSGATNPTQNWPDSSSSTVFHDGAHDDIYFHMGNYKNGYAGSSDTIRYDHVHNFPNILFNAFELRGIRFFCDDTNSFNSNTCFHTGQTPGSTYSAATLIGDSMTNP